MQRDAVKAGPHIYQILLENEKVRVLEVRGKPGSKSEMHTHPAMLAIGITDSKFKFTLPDGQTSEAELKPGQVVYLDPVEHTTEIMGSAEPHILLVELK